MNNYKYMLLGVVIGLACSFIFYTVLSIDNDTEKLQSSKDKNEPLYWVAPMDANFRKDKPGKSPMGMDLVPVYENKATDVDEGPGTIHISPDVINNLGVRTAVVSYDLLDTNLTTVGYVTYDEDTLVSIHSRVEGWIEKLHIKAVGDPVKKGQALYDIYSPELVNAQQEFLLALDRKNNRLISAAEKRLKALDVSQATMDELKKTRQTNAYVTFHAPQTGVVEQLSIREGFYAKPSDTLLTIVNLSTVWVEAEIFEQQAAQVNVDMPVTMTLDSLPSKKWQGIIDYIYPMLDVKTRTLKARLRFNNSRGELKPNMFANVRIHTTNNTKSLLIPKEALIRTGAQDRVVLALGEGVFKSIDVIAGRYGDKYVEILHGLRKGEKVVSSAQFLLDSESSKSSDFKRMSQSTFVSSANSVGIINSIIDKTMMNKTMMDVTTKSESSINISREAIEKWNRPAATVNFILAKGVSLEGLKVGKKVEFTFEVNAGIFTIIRIKDITEHDVEKSSSENIGKLNPRIINNNLWLVKRSLIPEVLLAEQSTKELRGRVINKTIGQLL